MRLPGKTLSSISWENGDTRLAFAIDSSLYLTIVRLDYKWAYMKGYENGLNGTVCLSLENSEINGKTIYFLNTRSGEIFTRTALTLYHLESCADACVILIKAPADFPGQYTLLVCNAVGAVIDEKYIEIIPKIVQITQDYIVCVGLDGSKVFCWAYREIRTRIIKEVSTNFQSLECKYKTTNFKQGYR